MGSIAENVCAARQLPVGNERLKGSGPSLHFGDFGAGTPLLQPAFFACGKARPPMLLPQADKVIAHLGPMAHCRTRDLI
jgi:hypothetical protein